MDPTSAFKNEVFRPLTTILVPGAVAAAPFALIVRHSYPGAEGFLTRHPLIGVAVLTIASLAAGFLMENLGSRLEVAIDRGKADKDARTTVWHRYLTLAFSVEPIGQRYLRTIVLRMKFELNFSVALVFSLLGWWWFALTETVWRTLGGLAVTGAHLATIALLLWEATDSADVLHRTRENLVEHYYTRNSTKPPAEGYTPTAGA